MNTSHPSHDFRSPGFFADAVKPFGSAEMLHPAAYQSLAFHEMEDLAVWTREWVCVGAHQDISHVDDLLPFTIGTHGVHVQRTSEGIVARFNKAQHGGCRSVPVQCQTGTKTRCSFTSCGFSRDRGPITASQLGGSTPELHQYLGLRPERLLAAEVRSWGPLIFVSLDAAPVDLATVAPSLESTAFFADERDVRLATYWHECKANWKLLAQALLGDLADPSGTDQWLSGQVRIAGTDLDAAWLFPNLVLLADAGQTCAIVLQPTAIGQTLCRVSVFGSAFNGLETTSRWDERLSPLLRRAEHNQDTAARWSSGWRPGTAETRLPLQDRCQGAWMQKILARKVLAVPAEMLDLQFFQSSRR